jgi:hypothetical protein
MEIHLVRTGGFGGMRREARVRTETLAPAEREPLEGLVRDAGFFSLPAKYPRPARGADFFTYSITVEERGRRHTVEVSEPSLPPDLKALVREVSKRL